MNHFLLENDTYVYTEEDFSKEDSLQKKKLLEFVNFMVYLGRVIPLDKDDKRRLKCLIDVSLLMGSYSPEGYRAVFSKLEISLILYYWYVPPLRVCRNNDCVFMQM